MLKLENIASYYGESLAINQINLEIKEGNFHGIIGKNGMGKSTLLKTIMGLMDKTDGVINLAGKDISKLKTNDRALDGLGYVPQGRGIMPQFTIEENLIVGTFARDKDNINNINEDFEFTLNLFPILKTFWKRRGGDLSGGQQQQLAIARALLTKPKILICFICDIIFSLVEEKLGVYKFNIKIINVYLNIIEHLFCQHDLLY